MTCPNCPRCGADTVTSRNGTATGEWQRRCLSCQATFYTVEVYAEQHPRHVFRMHRKEILNRSDNGGRTGS